MPLYPSAEALISDAALRLDQFGSDYGVLIVEGPDDKRFLCSRTCYRQQVIAAGGRRMLLAAHAVPVIRELNGIVFLTDCDYEVTLGNLSPSEGLIITRHADIEADLLDAGGFKRLILQVVATALDNEEELTRITAAARQRSIALADVLGRTRQVAKSEGFKIDTGSIRHHKYRLPGSADVDEKKLIRAVYQASREPTLPFDIFAERVISIGPSYDNCNGHDLIAALNHVLRDDFGVRGQSPDQLETLLRATIPETAFLALDFVARLQQWEERNVRRIIGL